MHWYFVMIRNPAEILRRPRPTAARKTRSSLRGGDRSLETIDGLPPTLDETVVAAQNLSVEEAAAPSLIDRPESDSGVNTPHIEAGRSGSAREDVAMLEVQDDEAPRQGTPDLPQAMPQADSLAPEPPAADDPDVTMEDADAADQTSQLIDAIGGFENRNQPGSLLASPSPEPELSVDADRPPGEQAPSGTGTGRTTPTPDDATKPSDDPVPEAAVIPREYPRDVATYDDRDPAA